MTVSLQAASSYDAVDNDAAQGAEDQGIQEDKGGGELSRWWMF